MCLVSLRLRARDTQIDTQGYHLTPYSRGHADNTVELTLDVSNIDDIVEHQAVIDTQAPGRRGENKAVRNRLKEISARQKKALERQ